jgi:hypothetical protein
MRCLHRMPGEDMMSLMLGVLGTHGHAWGSRTTGHMAALEPSCTRRRVWSHRTRGDIGVLPGGGPGASVTWQRQSFPAQGAGLEPWGTWRLRSPLLPGDRLGGLGHVATPEPFPSRWHAWCLRARGDTRALFWWVACSVPRGTWQSQSSLAPGTDLWPWGWSFKSCAQGYLVCRVPTDCVINQKDILPILSNNYKKNDLLNKHDHHGADHHTPM